MPRKNKRAPLEYQPSPAPSGNPRAPSWAIADGYEVREVASDKEYRCPGCDHVVRPGQRHLVVVPRGRGGGPAPLAHGMLAPGTAKDSASSPIRVGPRTSPTATLLRCGW